MIAPHDQDDAAIAPGADPMVKLAVALKLLKEARAEIAEIIDGVV